MKVARPAGRRLMMKKTVCLVFALLLISCAAVRADDIWEPALETINMFTLPDLFMWGDKYDNTEDFLREYQYYGAEVGTSEDDLLGRIIQYSDENAYERFTCSFFFTKDTGELWQIQMNTVYTAGDNPKDAWEGVNWYYNMYEMPRYFDKRMMDHAEGKFDGWLISADDITVYYSGFDYANYSQFGGRVFFSAMDREYYEKLLAELE